MAAERDSIRTLTARCVERTEPLPLRLRLAHLLQTADLAPGGLPPQAILLMRRVVAPQALTLAGARVNTRWEQSVRDVIAERYRTAARPEHGALPPNAEAILFADRSELLACLGVTVVRRSAGPCWYWHGTAGHATVPDAEALTRTWREAPLYLPAVLRHLLNWHQAAEVLQHLSDPQALSLLQAIVVAFRLPAEVASVQEPPRAARSAAIGGEPGVRREVESQAPAAGGPPADAAHQEAPPAGVQGSEARADSGERDTQGLPQWASGATLTLLSAEWLRLPRLSRRLLTLAMALAHASSPAQATATLWELERQLQRQVEPPLAPREADHAAVMRPASAMHARDDSGAAPEAGVSETAFTPIASFLSMATMSAGEPIARIARPEETFAVPNESGVSGTGEPIARSEAPDSLAPTPQPNQSLDRDAEPAAQPVEETAVDPFPYGTEGVDTRIGGVLYLLNLLLRADVPVCLDADDAFPLSGHLSLWGLTELLGRALLATQDADHGADPLWALLAHLDGRHSGEPPGADVPEGKIYRLPPIWLQRFARYIGRDTRGWHIGGTEARIVVWHADREFALLDCPRDGTSLARAWERERAWYGAQGGDPGLFAPGDESLLSVPTLFEEATDSWSEAEWPVLHWLSRCQERAGWEALPVGLLRWIRGAFPFLRWLLRRMLGYDGTADAEIEEALCVPGRLYATATHVDLVMALNSISLPVRRVGLDVNPGWLPDVMRVVSFHFE